MKTRIWTAAITLASLGALPASSMAAFDPLFTGNSEAYFQHLAPGNNFPQPTSDGIMNFAVYENTTGDWATALGVTLNPMDENDLAPNAPPPDTTSKYVYFYQLVNTNPFAPDDSLSEFQITRLQDVFNQGGFLTDANGVPLVFNEAVGGATGGSGNPAIGTATLDANPGNHVPGFAGGLLDPNSPFVTDASALVPINYNKLTEFNEFEWNPPLVVPGATLAHTVVVYITSNLPPVYDLGRTHDGTASDGDVPVPNPEPGTFAGVVGALACGFGSILVRRKKRE